MIAGQYVLSLFRGPLKAISRQKFAKRELSFFGISTSEPTTGILGRYDDSLARNPPKRFEATYPTSAGKPSSIAGRRDTYSCRRVASG
jgi:hypothetical protein